MGKNRNHKNNKKEPKNNDSAGLKEAHAAAPAQKDSSVLEPVPPPPSPAKEIKKASPPNSPSYSDVVKGSSGSSSTETLPLPVEEEGSLKTEFASPVSSTQSPHRSIGSNFQIDTVYPVHSEDEIDYYNDATEQLQTIEHQHHPHVESSPAVDSQPSVTAEEDKAHIPIELPKVSEESIYKAESTTTTTEVPPEVTMEKTEIMPEHLETQQQKTTEELNKTEPEFEHESNKPYPEAVLIARNVLIEVTEDDVDLSSTWRIVDDAAAIATTYYPTMTTATTSEPTNIMHTIQYLGKETTTHLQENVEPFCPPSSLGELNTIEYLVLILESIYHQVIQFLEPSASTCSEEIYPPSTSARRYTTTTNTTTAVSTWKTFVGMFLVEALRQFVKLQLYITLVVVKYSMMVTLTLLSWSLWWLLSPIRRITGTITWVVKLGISLLIVLLHFLPGNHKLPKGINGSVVVTE